MRVALREQQLEYESQVSGVCVCDRLQRSTKIYNMCISRSHTMHREGQHIRVMAVLQRLPETTWQARSIMRSHWLLAHAQVGAHVQPVLV